MNNYDLNIGIIGIGNMGTAILESILNAGHDKQKIYVSRRGIGHLTEIERKYSVYTFDDNKKVAEKSDILILAVKPQNIEGVLSEIREQVTNDNLVISIAAARSISYLERELGEDKKIIRAMPSLGLATKTGATVYTMNSSCQEADAAIMQYIFSKSGYADPLEESLIDAATYGACCIGLIARYLDASVDAMTNEGIDKEIASQLILSALLTTAALVDSGKSLKDIYTQVASPGGLTQAANEYADGNKMYNDIIPGMLNAAMTRAKELSET